MKRRNRRLALRHPEGAAAVRHMCMDKTKVDKYFFALKELLTKSGLLEKPKLIWNMDETRLQLKQVPRTVIARKGSKYLYRVAQVETKRPSQLPHASMPLKTRFHHTSLWKGKHSVPCMALIWEVHPMEQNGVYQQRVGRKKALPSYGVRRCFCQTLDLRGLKCWNLMDMTPTILWNWLSWQSQTELRSLNFQHILLTGYSPVTELSSSRWRMPTIKSARNWQMSNWVSRSSRIESKLLWSSVKGLDQGTECG